MRELKPVKGPDSLESASNIILIAYLLLMPVSIIIGILLPRDLGGTIFAFGLGLFFLLGIPVIVTLLILQGKEKKRVNSYRDYFFEVIKNK